MIICMWLFLTSCVIRANVNCQSLNPDCFQKMTLKLVSLILTASVLGLTSGSRGWDYGERQYQQRYQQQQQSQPQRELLRMRRQPAPVNRQLRPQGPPQRQQQPLGNNARNFRIKPVAGAQRPVAGGQRQVVDKRQGFVPSPPVNRRLRPAQPEKQAFRPEPAPAPQQPEKRVLQTYKPVEPQQFESESIRAETYDQYEPEQYQPRPVVQRQPERPIYERSPVRADKRQDDSIVEESIAVPREQHDLQASVHAAANGYRGVSRVDF